MRSIWQDEATKLREAKRFAQGHTAHLLLKQSKRELGLLNPKFIHQWTCYLIPPIPQLGGLEWWYVLIINNNNKIATTKTVIKLTCINHFWHDRHCFKLLIYITSFNSHFDPG